MSNPLADLRSAENTLVSSIDRAAEMVAQIGTSKVDDSVNRFSGACMDAAGRLRDAQAQLALLAGGLLADLLAFAGCIDADVRVIDAPPALPAPAADAAEPTAKGGRGSRRPRLT